MWTDACHAAFLQLKEALISAPHFGVPCFELALSFVR